MVRCGVSGGKTGKVLQVMGAGDRAIVEGLRLVKKAMRKTQDNPQGGIAEREGSIHISNLMLYCPECKKGVKTGQIKDGEKSHRKCKKCGHVFEG